MYGFLASLPLSKGQRNGNGPSPYATCILTLTHPTKSRIRVCKGKEPARKGNGTRQLVDEISRLQPEQFPLCLQ